MEQLSKQNLEKLIDYLLEAAVSYLPKVALALLVLIIGLWLIRRIVKMTAFALNNSANDPSLTKFVSSLVSIGLKLVLLVVIASMLGVATTSLVAILGAAGLAVALALQGSLSNFAGGVLILVLRPFRYGDFIEAQGSSGTVKDIQIFHTVLHTADNRVVIIPNGALINDIIVNYTREPTRRVDFVFGIGYDDDITAAKNLIRSIVNDDPRIMKDPEPLVVVSEIADSSVNLTVRVWADTAEYWNVKFDVTERVKLAFDDKGITIPYPQQQLHLVKTEESAA